jgi:hypothetical protein
MSSTKSLTWASEVCRASSSTFASHRVASSTPSSPAASFRQLANPVPSLALKEDDLPNKAFDILVSRG